MHNIEFRQIMRDAEIANAIFPVGDRHCLPQTASEEALRELAVPRAANIARICVSLGLSVFSRGWRLISDLRVADLCPLVLSACTRLGPSLTINGAQDG